MTKISIDPTTLRQIHFFGRRRRLISGLRGGLVGLAVLLVVFLLIAGIDWLTVLPNGVRWGLTIAGYFVAAMAAWFLGIHDSLRHATDAQLARFMENAAPEFREELLSAVELADFDPETVRDSPEFRRLIQDMVARRIEHMEPKRLLPWSRLKKSVLAAGGGLALGAVFIVIVGVSFASRLILRAAVPGANIARVTGVEIEILEPEPASLITLAGDPVTLRFRVSKPEVRIAELTLETEGRKRVVQLRPIQPGVFETTLHPNRAPIHYSLAAGDAKSPSHQIEPHTPPVILDFRKRYVFPDYLGRDAQDIRERDGHLKAIEGTTVQLQITTDQPSVGEIRMTMGGESKTIPLIATDERLQAELPLVNSGRYQIYLKGRRSNFPAEFAPTYQITAHADQAPRIRLLQPITERVVQPDAVIPFQAQVEDDHGIVKVEQWLSRNGGDDWEKFPVASKPGRQTPIAFNWDLLKHHLEAGDLITTKLVAYDGRGEIAESREVDLTINFRDLDPERLAGLQARERAFTILEELSENSSTTFNRIKEDLKTDKADLAQLYEMDREAWSAMGRLREPLQNVPLGRDAYDLNLATRSTAIGRHFGIRQAILRMPFARSLSDKLARKAHFESAATEASSTMRHYGKGRELVRAMLAEELPRIALGDFLDLRRQAELLLPESSDNDESPNGQADELRRFGRVLGLTLHRAKAITSSLGEFDVSWRNPQAEKLHDVSASIGPRLESLSLDLETLRAKTQKSQSAINQLGSWWQFDAIPFVDFDEAFHHKYAPEQTIELGNAVEGRHWRKLSDWDEGVPRELARPETVVYLFRTLTTSKENTVEAEFSCREGVSIWLNGEVWVQDRNRRSNQAERYRMTLKPGQNNLLVKLVNRRHPHPFSFQIENGRLEGDVDELATEADKLQFLSRETKSVLDDAIRALQPVLVQMAEVTQRKRADNEREAAETRSLATALGRLVGRSVFFGIGRQKDTQHSPRDRDFLSEVPEVKWMTYTDALDSFAWLDGIRQDSDTQFCRATGLLARAFEHMRPEFQKTETATAADYPDTSRYTPQTQARREFDGRMKTINEQFLLLERSYEIREIERAIRELAAHEDWRSQGPEPRTRHPFEWQFIVDRLEDVGVKLSQGGEAIQVGSEVLDVLNSDQARQVSHQMEQRLETLGPVTNLQPQLAEIRNRLATIIKRMKTQESQAVAAIQAEAPSLAELLVAAERATKDLEARSRQAVVEIADADETVAFARTRELFLAQQRNDRLLRNVMNAFRQDANSQNMLLAEGRARSRDVDAALEWLRLPAKLSSAAFEDALFAKTPREQRHFLEDGGLNQGMLANRLGMLMRHLRALEAGEPVVEFRNVLRELEVEFEIRERLDREYGQLERVADMAKLDNSSKLIAALENELSGNNAMQRELDTLTRNAAQDSLTNLQRAAMAESAIQKRLKKEAVRQGESRPAMSKPEIKTAKTESEANVAKLRQIAQAIRESHLSLRAQHQQLRGRHEQFANAKSDFLDIELPAIGMKGDDLTTLAESLKQTSAQAQKKFLAENADLTKRDHTDELTASTSALKSRRDTIEEISGTSEEAGKTVQDSLQQLDSAMQILPAKHAGDLRIASKVYQSASETRNAAARLEAAAEAEFNADRQIIAANTQLSEKPREDLVRLIDEFRDLSKIRMPASIEKARKVGATDAATNHAQAAKDAASALAVIPKSNADILSLSKSLEQLGDHLRDAGTEMIRASRIMKVQVEGPAKVAYSAALKQADDIKRIENQARQQRDLKARAINAMRPRGKRTLPENEMKQKQLEADNAGQLAAELTRQAERMTADHQGKIEKTKAVFSEVTAAIEASNADGKLAQTLGDQFLALGEQIQTQIASFKPREDSNAARMANRLTAEATHVNELSEGLEKLALRINPNVHTPSQTEVAARQAEEAYQKATALLAEKAALENGLQTDDLLSQITKASQADAEAHAQLAKAEKELLKLIEWEALPEPDPNPKRAASSIQFAAEDQSTIVSLVGIAGESLLRAAAHEQQLGHPQSARELGQLARSVFDLAETQIPREANRMRVTTKLLATAESVKTAEKSIRLQIEALRSLLFPEASVGSRIVDVKDEMEWTNEPLSRREAEVSEQLARVMFLVQQRVPKETVLAKLELSQAGVRSTVDPDFAQHEPTTPPEASPTETKNNPSQPDENQTKPEVALTKPEDSATKPENPPTKPEDSAAQAENAPAKPEDAATKPENATAKPENAPAKPENAATEPENAPAKPEDAAAKPENAPAKPENAPAKPENAPAKPENAATEPENAPAKPEDAATKPENAPAKPEDKPAKPEDAAAKPENAPAKPENAPAKPEDAAAKPENAPATPENAPAEALPVTPELADAIAELVETQVQAIQAERNAKIDALPDVELDETVIERDSFSDDLDRLAHLRDRNWNAFREEGERELSLGNENTIDGIYRNAIEAYFRVISRNIEAKPEANANER